MLFRTSPWLALTTHRWSGLCLSIQGLLVATQGNKMSVYPTLCLVLVILWGMHFSKRCYWRAWWVCARRSFWPQNLQIKSRNNISFGFQTRRIGPLFWHAPTAISLPWWSCRSRVAKRNMRPSVRIASPTFKLTGTLVGLQGYLLGCSGRSRCGCHKLDKIHADNYRLHVPPSTLALFLRCRLSPVSPV